MFSASDEPTGIGAIVVAWKRWGAAVAPSEVSGTYRPDPPENVKPSVPLVTPDARAITEIW